MSAYTDKGLQGHDAEDRLSQATDWFLRVRSESARIEDLPEFQRWLERDPSNATAYHEVSASWEVVGAHASAPEFVIARRDALEDARRASAHRWLRRPHMRGALAAAAAIAGVAIVLAWSLFSQAGTLYSTDLGERRTLTLSDGSVVSLDARSRLRVTYTDETRSIALEAGQARFDVAKDPARPFRVRAGTQTVVALGTQFNVELVADTVLVTLIEGKVAVTGVHETSPLSTLGERKGSAKREGEVPAERGTVVTTTRGKASTIEMHAGEQLIAVANKPSQLRPNVDVARATAWQTGKLFFDDEPLVSAAARINRYARQEIEIDPSVSAVGISGVFNAGDTAAFTEAVTTYFPVKIERSTDSSIHLTAR